MKFKKILSIIMVGILVMVLGGCGLSKDSNGTSSEVVIESVSSTEAVSTESTTVTNEEEILLVNEAVSGNSLLDIEDMFSDRDIDQVPDLSDGIYINLESDNTVILNEEGVYVLSGTVTDSMIIVEVEDEDKVQIVLDGVSMVNKDMPTIYVKSGDKVFVTTTDSLNELEVSGAYEADGDVNLDAVIYSKSDLVFNGIGNLIIYSVEGNGITSKDDLIITGGTYEITSAEHSLEANDSIRIYDGDITINTGKDGLHSENEDDLSLGYIYILNGRLTITSADDAIHGTSIVQIDGGSITIDECVEGIEGTSIMINGGIIDIYSTDDGINATSLSDLDVMIEVNGGQITIVMASGDTDGFDSNGDMTINGGNIDVTGGSTFDADGSAVLNGGTVVVNGEVVTELPESQMGRGRGQGPDPGKVKHN